MIEQIYNDIMSPDVNLAGAIFKLLLSMVLGASIGYERRRKGQIAGLRTFALIAMGATLAMLISIYIPQVYYGLKNGDPGRIAAQVVSGIGFLGAGAIIQMKGSVRGLTTAAGIWISACIGLAVGAGMYLVSLIATLLIIFILVNIERIEQRANMLWETKVIRIKVGEIVTDRDACKAVFKQHKLHAIVESMKYDYENNTSIINYRVLTRKSTDIASLFDELKAQYDKTLSISLTNEANL
ncbi:MAG: MgtC/SapB family protein [Muribaculaceae bacterium]|nr:MgtC/SapB family protein [Muribaculaceae bacterium]